MSRKHGCQLQHAESAGACTVATNRQCAMRNVAMELPLPLSLPAARDVAPSSATCSSSIICRIFSCGYVSNVGEK